jgi:hypothetical protein
LESGIQWLAAEPTPLSQQKKGKDATSQNGWMKILQRVVFGGGKKRSRARGKATHLHLPRPCAATEQAYYSLASCNKQKENKLQLIDQFPPRCCHA